MNDNWEDVVTGLKRQLSSGGNLVPFQYKAVQSPLQLQFQGKQHTVASIGTCTHVGHIYAYRYMCKLQFKLYFNYKQ